MLVVVVGFEQRTREHELTELGKDAARPLGDLRRWVELNIERFPSKD